MRDLYIIESVKKTGAFEIRSTSDPTRFTHPATPTYRTRIEAEKQAAIYQEQMDEMAADREADDASGEYTTKKVGILGGGRVYKSQPGATQYDNGNGRHSIQIWDN